MTTTQIKIFVKSFTIFSNLPGRSPAHFPSLSLSGGEGGIRTPVELSPKAVFKTAAIDHSATSPFADWHGRRDLNPQPTVLETATLPIELLPYPPNLRTKRETEKIEPPPPELNKHYEMTSDTRPAPIVRPPSRIAKRWPFSIATGFCISMSTATLSPGMTISTPVGRVSVPVTSEVRK
jgi:hypothetical protein